MYLRYNIRGLIYFHLNDHPALGGKHLISSREMSRKPSFLGLRQTSSLDTLLQWPRGKCIAFFQFIKVKPILPPQRANLYHAPLKSGIQFRLSKENHRLPREQMDEAFRHVSYERVLHLLSACVHIWVTQNDPGGSLSK